MTIMSATHPWTEQNGVWRRKLGSMESFYLTLASPDGQAVHWMIGCCVSIEYLGHDSIDTENLIRQAWKDIRRNYPNASAVVDRDTEEIVVRYDDTESLDRSFKVHDSITADELFSAFKSQLSMTLHFLRKSNELVFQAPHVLIDGRGTLYLLHALFTALSKQSEEHPTANDSKLEIEPLINLTKPYDEWLGVSPIPTEKNVKDAESIFQRILAQKSPIGLPGVEFEREPRRAVHRDLGLDEGSTRAIIKACKQKGVTVTAAWHAAVIMATQGIQSSACEEGTSYTQFTTIDLRRYFPAPFSAQTDSIGSLQTALPFTITPSKDNTFINTAKSLYNEYKSPFAFANNDFSYLGPYMAMSKQIIATGSVPPSSTPYLSSMGIVDDFLAPQYGQWQLGRFWISSTMLTSDFQIYLWTWKEKMVFSACFNDAFYELPDADLVLERTRDELVKGLGLELSEGL